MKQQNQLNSIANILGNTVPVIDAESDHYEADEKCGAIRNYMENKELSFDFSFVNSVEEQYIRNRGHCSRKQIAALDSIIVKYRIDVVRWV